MAFSDTRLWSGLLTLAVLAAPASLEAQRSPDFLFRTPKVTLGVRAGLAAPRASSEIFEFAQDRLTLARSDFQTVGFGAQLGIRATDRLEIALDLSRDRSETRSEYRDWVGTDDLPIEQFTVLQRVPLTASLKWYLVDRGRSISRFAWIPADWAPYVGGGGGVLWYVFEQEGEWVDELPEDPGDCCDIVRLRLRSDGGVPTGHLMAGADISLGPRFLLNAEGRYLWASGSPSSHFSEFDDIDLSGFQVTAGIAVRF